MIWRIRATLDERMRPHSPLSTSVSVCRLLCLSPSLCLGVWASSLSLTPSPLGSPLPPRREGRQGALRGGLGARGGGAGGGRVGTGRDGTGGGAGGGGGADKGAGGAEGGAEGAGPGASERAGRRAAGSRRRGPTRLAPGHSRGAELAG